MATTPNYGFIMPDPTDFVTDLPADFEIFGDEVDSRIKALNPETTAGDISYRGATANAKVRLPIGTAGQILTVNSGATAPEWKTFAGGGKVLQVVEGTTSTTTSIASSTYTDTGITATITPSATTSRIMVIVSAPISLIRDSSTNFAGMRLVRNSTNLTTNDYAVGFTNNNSTSFEVNHTLSFNFVDSPNSTSALTYKIQGNVLFTANTGTVRYNYPNTRSSIILVEIGA